MDNVSFAEAVEMLVEISGISGIRSETKLGELGLDSLQVIEWVGMLEERLDVEFNLQDIDMGVFTDRSVSDVLDEFNEQAADLRRIERAGLPNIQQ
jgi:acyl carrier protein